MMAISLKACKITDMAAKQTMSEILRGCLQAAPSLNAIEKATGVRRQSMAAFMRGDQVSIHLASADALAEYFGVECRLPPSKQRKRG